MRIGRKIVWQISVCYLVISHVEREKEKHSEFEAKHTWTTGTRERRKMAQGYK
jgi:hypothetical protein